MRCAECGHRADSGTARFCSSCGAPLAVALPPALAGKIIDYRDLIDRSTPEFVGRQWVREAVDDFLAQDGPRCLLLLGEPGCGKTAFMTDLVRTRGYAHHFIGKRSPLDIVSSAAWRDPVTFAESVGYQLVRDYGVVGGLHERDRRRSVGAIREACAVAGWVRPEFYRVAGLLAGRFMPAA